MKKHTLVILPSVLALAIGMYQPAAHAAVTTDAAIVGTESQWWNTYKVTLTNSGSKAIELRGARVVFDSNLSMSAPSWSATGVSYPGMKFTSNAQGNIFKNTLTLSFDSGDWIKSQLAPGGHIELTLGVNGVLNLALLQKTIHLGADSSEGGVVDPSPDVIPPTDLVPPVVVPPTDLVPPVVVPPVVIPPTDLEPPIVVPPTDLEPPIVKPPVKPEVPEVETPTPPPTGKLCASFNVYPDWIRGDHATGGDIMVNNNIAYSAIYWTNTAPGSDSSWSLHLNCDGTEAGTAPLLSLRNPMDPVRLEVAGWPNKLVVASPSTNAPTTVIIDTAYGDALSDVEQLTQAFVSVIRKTEKAGSASIIINSDVLDLATKDKGKSFGTVAVKKALINATNSTGSRIDTHAINALSNDVKGWAQAHNLIIKTLAPKATFGWLLSIGDFAYDEHSGRRSVWNEASVFTADLLDSFELYKTDAPNKADFAAFTKSGQTEALNSEQWHNALEYVKQVTDYVQAPAMLADMPTEQTSGYFMGDSAGKPHLRKAAYSNVFAIIFDKKSPELNAKIRRYQDAKIPLYYVGDELQKGDLTRIKALNRQLADAEHAMDNEVFLYETPTEGWVPSTVYKWNDFLDGLNAMHNIGVAGNKFWLIDDKVSDETSIKYAKVAIAAFLAQSMQETIRYNACDENNWSEVRYGAPTDYPMTASCGQLGQKYADYGVNPTSGLDYAYSCPRDNKMEVSALTHAKWYGAPAPVFAVPDAVLQESNQLVNGAVGRWTNEGHCNDVPKKIDASKQVWERDTCKIYEGQKAGKWLWDGSSQASVEGCGWWGRGVIQTTGRQNFGTLNHYLGRSHVDPSIIGKTIDGVTVEAPPANPLYAELDFCSNPGLICSSEENKEIKWIAGLFYWVTSVQAYSNEGGQYADWNYYNELKKYVDGGLKGSQFIDAVSGIVNRGCPSSVCSTGEVHNMKERRDNFRLALKKLGLHPQ